MNLPDWSRANCLGCDPTLFFPEIEDQATVQHTYAEARRVCASCVIRDECLAYAVEANERWGIWGGRSPRERERMRSGTPLSARKHGSYTTYNTHGCRCGPCSEAAAERRRVDYERQRGTA